MPLSNHPFGWSLPPGVSLSDPGGPDDPRRIAYELAAERLWDAFYQATRADLDAKDITDFWADAAQQALADEAEMEARFGEQDDEPEVDDEPPPDYGPPGSGAIITEYP